MSSGKRLRHKARQMVGRDARAMVRAYCDNINALSIGRRLRFAWRAARGKL